MNSIKTNEVIGLDGTIARKQEMTRVSSAVPMDNFSSWLTSYSNLGQAMREMNQNSIWGWVDRVAERSVRSLC